MIEYIFTLAVLYIFLFVSGAILKSLNPKIEKIIFCTTCFSFFVATIVAFFLKFPPVIVALMLGANVTGIAYKLDEITRKEEVSYLFIFELVLILVALLIMALYTSQVI